MIYGMPWSIRFMYVIFGSMIQQCYRQLHHEKAKPLVCILSLVQHCYLQLHHRGKGKTLYVIFGCAVPLHQETRRPSESFVASQHEEPIQILHQPRDWCSKVWYPTIDFYIQFYTNLVCGKVFPVCILLAEKVHSEQKDTAHNLKYSLNIQRLLTT